MVRYRDEYSRSEGGGGGGWFWWLVILVLVAGGIYWWWGGVPFLSSKKISFKLADLPELLKKAPANLKELKVLSEDLTQKLWRGATKKPGEFAGAILEDVGKKAAESFKEQTADVLGLGQTLAPNKFAIVRPVRQGLSLLLESGEESIKYNLDWGDGRKEEGELAGKIKKTFEHVWEEPGDFAVVVTVTNIKGEDKKTFTFPLTVIK